MNNFGKNIAVWIIIVIFLITIFNLFQNKNDDPRNLNLAYSEFLSLEFKGKSSIIINLVFHIKPSDSNS